MRFILPAVAQCVRHSAPCGMGWEGGWGWGGQMIRREQLEERMKGRPAVQLVEHGRRYTLDYMDVGCWRPCFW